MKIDIKIILIFFYTIFNCTYLDMARRVRKAEISYQKYPSQIAKREISPERCIIVYGKVKSDKKIDCPVVVAAFSYKYGKQELVDYQQLNRLGYYVLSLPIGQYQIFVFADINNDLTFDNTECVGYYDGSPMLDVEQKDSSQTILDNTDISISVENAWTLDMPFKLAVSIAMDEIQSDIYPSGSVRSLDDDIFSQKRGLLGLYNPAAFHRQAGVYFFAIRERDFCKIPIVFVHGIGGTPRDWKYIVEGIDSSRFDPWFFYYPSGESLDKMADVFYELFLSGKLANKQQRDFIIFAHSMGGLVVRAAINKYSKKMKDDFLELYVSICTPYGGNDAAAAGVKKAPVVISSWRDVATGSDFITRLYETPILSHMKFYLLFGYRNDNSIKLGDNSDGTIALKSQLDPRAQSEATFIHGYNETHTSILESEDVLKTLNEILSVYKRMDKEDWKD